MATMHGMSATTGRATSGLDHLQQSIRGILTTPIGSRVMRRDYGSRLFDLVDKPYSAANQLAIIAATADALLKWEPRFALDSVKVQSFAPGQVVIDLIGTYLPGGDPVRLEGIELS
ncbi:baseplate assembly protein [Aliiroseovarius zhejiangensis]|uniref:Baseplate assembly protein n=1 Tax=Aliiroseovarius zhejiangensis TaxID=1632025 RepID=A0ABQ3IS29_9RHOB|nr:GPW/gp25 family protein [Aliiroseovarius zhejiangensis]GHE88282.1 baseplate assembly protein [Aliiroseovarius zhejiangensis]